MYVTSRVFYDQFQTDCRPTAIATWFKIILECLDFLLNLGVGG